MRAAGREGDRRASGDAWCIHNSRRGGGAPHRQRLVRHRHNTIGPMTLVSPKAKRNAHAVCSQKTWRGSAQIR